MDNLEPTTTVTPTQDNSQEPVDAEKAKRHSEQMEGARQEVERMKAEAEKAQTIAYKAAVSAAKVDGSSLLELYNEDPKLAERVAKEGFGMTIDQVKAHVNGELPPVPQTITPEDAEKLFEEKYEARKTEEMHQESLKIAEGIFGKIKDESLQSEAKKQFELLSEGRKLTPSLANQLAEMATLYVNKDNLMSGAYTRSVEALSSTGLSPSKKSTENKQDVGRIGLDGKFYPPTN